MTNKTSISPMLATELTYSAFYDTFINDDWLMQVKHNGYRGIVSCKNGTVTLHTRNGISQLSWKTANLNIPDFVIDCEMFGDELAVAFDLMEWDSFSYYDETLEFRVKLLSEHKELLQKAVKDLKIIVTKTAKTKAQKQLISQRTRAVQAEGVVFKHKLSTYKVGTRSKEWLKYPYRYNTRMLVLNRSGDITEVGQIFGGTVLGRTQMEDVPGNITAGKIIDVTYTWAMPDNRLVQPKFQRLSTGQSIELVIEQPLIREPQI